jgi:hypothetical protein
MSTKVLMGMLGVSLAFNACTDVGAVDDEAQSAVGAALSADSQADDDAGGGVGKGRCPDQVPAALDPPADATLTAAFAAKGVQIYTCASPAPGVAPAWTLKAPHAVLLKSADAAGIHFAGPSWEANDGSLVTGAKVAAAPSPDPTAIPWLLLKAATNAGQGLFSDVTWIQRLDTVGGLAPAAGCDDAHVSSEVLVPYRADYFFYHSAAGVKRIKQCASQ